MNTQILRPVEILLVEDSPSDAHLTMQHLRHAEIANNLNWVQDGESAIDYVRQRGAYANSLRPDLIVLDLNLPGMDGHEVLAEIKADPQLKMIPVVILTTSINEQDVAQSYNLNANCYVSKPFDIQQFIYAIHMLRDHWLTVAKLPLS
ncbi:response regulator [Leptolyngbya sp. AN02str]|uniref:response regulator n=1 Tax=Leptolyngbya sp. AN02str TaxID=3423363 RepID=UPI003D31C91B